jgi:DNA-directed RNA polymerase subunit RPC12/RpoP
MTTVTNERNYFITAKTYANTMTTRLNQRQGWIRCPRCIGGNMHHEDNGEYVCMQCGCSYYPDKDTQAPIVRGIL